MENDEKKRKDKIYICIISLIIGAAILINSLMVYFCDNDDKTTFLLVWSILGAICILILGIFGILVNRKKNIK